MSIKGLCVKCYEVTKCSEQERSSCFVWNSFRTNPGDFEDIKCWTLKNIFESGDEKLIKKCQACSYYLMMHKDSGIISDFNNDISFINCDGVINIDRCTALTTVWEQLKNQGKFKIILNLANTTNIYSCGLGTIVKIHKEALNNKGQLVVVGAQGYTLATFESTKLDRVLTLVSDNRAAKEIFDKLKKKEDAAKQTTKPIPATLPAPVTAPSAEQKKRSPCWEYWKNKNPRNATLCDECFRKQSPSNQPCWIVEGIIEGVSFQYVNEECEDCDYFKEFSASASS